MIAFARQLGTGVRTLVLLTLLLGVAYPVAVWGVGQVVGTHQAEGSLLRRDGHVVGSSLIAQRFDGPQWFHARPSAAKYDPLASAASNKGPSNRDLLAAIAARRAAVAKEEGVAAGAVPADAVTASASGLDPYISPAYAALQARRVAARHGLSVAAVQALIASHTQGRSLGFLGEPRVDVVDLDLALSGTSAAR